MFASARRRSVTILFVPYVHLRIIAVPCFTVTSTNSDGIYPAWAPEMAGDLAFLDTTELDELQISDRGTLLVNAVLRAA
jgi:hypothetical protein